MTLFHLHNTLCLYTYTHARHVPLRLTLAIQYSKENKWTEQFDGWALPFFNALCSSISTGFT